MKTSNFLNFLCAIALVSVSLVSCSSDSIDSELEETQLELIADSEIIDENLSSAKLSQAIRNAVPRCINGQFRILGRITNTTVRSQIRTMLNLGNTEADFATRICRTAGQVAIVAIN